MLATNAGTPGMEASQVILASGEMCMVHRLHGQCCCGPGWLCGMQ